jgi:hypothetical protein
LFQFEFCSDLIFLNSRNGKCEKKAKKQTAKKKKKKKWTHPKWAKPTISQGVTVPQKEGHAQKQSNGPGPVTIGGCAAWGLHQPGWSIGVPLKDPLGY